MSAGMDAGRKQILGTLDAIVRENLVFEVVQVQTGAYFFFLKSLL